jgi:hypothetical protein
MYASQAPGWLFIFVIQEFIYFRPMYSEYKHSSSKNGSKTQNCDINENGSNDFNYVQVIYGDHNPK